MIYNSQINRFQIPPVIKFPAVSKDFGNHINVTINIIYMSNFSEKKIDKNNIIYILHFNGLEIVNKADQTENYPVQF